MEEVKSLEGYGRLKMGTAECVSDDMIRGDDGASERVRKIATTQIGCGLVSMIRVVAPADNMHYDAKG